MLNSHSNVTPMIEVTDHLWIPMPDGTRLAARLWLPKLGYPIPAVFEYIPYRKTDMVRARDERNNPYFAANGIAALRVDMRGSGDSEGTMPDMYAATELDDARRIVEWMAEQPWCNGHVGMFGTSWGGTSALQISRDKPEALKAVIAVCATHDRYEDDIHHKGGCLLTDTFEWGATLPAILGSPLSPAVGNDWLDKWKSRIADLSFPLENWVRNEARGKYWRHGSIIHDVDRLNCPILAVGGWADRYSNSVMSLVDARPDLVWGVVGPWGHHYPDHGHPGPAMGFQDLALTWFRHWLQDDPVKPPETPKLRVWLREYDRPQDSLDIRSGAWMEAGPTPKWSTHETLHLTTDGLCSTTAAPIDSAVTANLRLGIAAGDTGYFGRFGGLPLEQRDEDALCLQFDTAPLDDDLILFGRASAELVLSAELPRSQLCLRLCDVSPDGSSNRIALSIRNLCLDEQLDAPEVLEPIARRRYRIPFHAKAYRVRRGHRLRLAIGASYWPMVWTPPELGKITVHRGSMYIPRLTGAPRTPRESIPPARDLPVRKSYSTLSDPPVKRYREDRNDGKLAQGWYQAPVRLRYHDTQTDFEYETRANHVLDTEDPLSASTEFDHRMSYSRPDGEATVRCVVTVNSTSETYFLDGRFTATWKGKIIGQRHWDCAVPRVFS